MTQQDLIWHEMTQISPSAPGLCLRSDQPASVSSPSPFPPWDLAGSSLGHADGERECHFSSTHWCMWCMHKMSKERKYSLNICMLTFAFIDIWTSPDQETNLHELGFHILPKTQISFEVWILIDFWVILKLHFNSTDTCALTGCKLWRY